MKNETVLRRQLFVSLGLAEKEAALYDTLLSHGQMAAASLEKISGLKKNTYVLLKRLEKRGLVQKIIKEGKSHYIPGSPSKLKLYAVEQEERIKETKALLAEALPILEREYRETVGRPVVQYYSGVTGVQQVFEEVYADNKKEILGCVGWLKPNPRISELVGRLASERVKRGITTRAINNDTSESRQYFEEAKNLNNLAEVFLVNKEKYPMPVEIDVWNETVGIMSFADNDFQGMLIEHRDIATTLASLLRLTFDLLRARKQAGNGD